jgi:hypothetical protein
LALLQRKYAKSRNIASLCFSFRLPTCNTSRTTGRILMNFKSKGTTYVVTFNFNQNRMTVTVTLREDLPMLLGTFRV